MAKPLSDPFNIYIYKWKDEHQTTFEDVKQRLSSALVLKFPNFTKLFKIHIDANDFDIGRILMQKGHPIAFESKKLYVAQL
jgi:hypothetical protein